MRCTARAAQAGYEISNKNSVAEEPTPPDLYTGDDKQSLEKLIRDAWAKAYPQDEIMGVRFSMQEWKRDVKKVWEQASKSYSLRDKYVLAVRVVVKTSAESATIFPAYINRDNLSGSLKPGVATKTREHVVKQMLVANYQT